MSIQQLFVCDGCSKEEKCGADWNHPPKGWRAFLVNSCMYHVCNVECGQMAVKKLVEDLFKNEPVKY